MRRCHGTRCRWQEECRCAAGARGADEKSRRGYLPIRQPLRTATDAVGAPRLRCASSPVLIRVATFTAGTIPLRSSALRPLRGIRSGQEAESTTAAPSENIEPDPIQIPDVYARPEEK